VDVVYNLGVGQREFANESGEFWSKEQLTNWCQSSTDVLLVAEKDGKVVGFSLYAAHLTTGKVTWENLYVEPSARGLGIAGALAEEGLKKIKELGYPYVMLCVNAEDQEAFASFVEKYGFKRGDKVLWMDQVIK
jgi:ribosomal protein S18 acetylase RimI-like enzyme